jgi:hypothetical protein
MRDMTPKEKAKELIMKYRIKSKYKTYLARYAWTSLDIDGVYTKEEWNTAGFKDLLLETV